MTVFPTWEASMGAFTQPPEHSHEAVLYLADYIARCLR